MPAATDWCSYACGQPTTSEPYAPKGELCSQVLQSGHLFNDTIQHHQQQKCCHLSFLCQAVQSVVLPSAFCFIYFFLLLPDPFFLAGQELGDGEEFCIVLWDITSVFFFFFFFLFCCSPFFSTSFLGAKVWWKKTAQWSQLEHWPCVLWHPLRSPALVTVWAPSVC